MEVLLIFDVKNMSFVLLPLNSTILTFVQSLLQPVHECILKISLNNISGGADICSSMSSTNEWCVTECSQ